MMKIGATAFFGFLALSPAARAVEAPAFVNAAMCEAAAPFTAATAFLRRQVRAERPVARRPAAVRPSAVRAHRDAGRSLPRPQPRPVDEAPALDGEAVLRPAVHFCVTPANTAAAVRYT
ncbi:hypothetical protein EAH89_09450 [Roseomonas nepalensis]|uniref:Uncharacterized protein n=1 Tax=Muricoccus nepalensis TaxID=1854500 RepID=A0A502G967_9PROT|nr:hypothetical protein [Roseomonas nepalensis]TPG58172.1 hypothetical protein EAH89_09450 [Roseomonas nepalensis]